MPFGVKEDRHWLPVPTVLEWLSTKVIKPTDLVLDIGCGHCPFPRANVGVDRLDRATLEKYWDKLKVKGRPERLIHHDFTYKLPIKDKSIDFVYCRHTLEDMYNPFFLLGEMQRIGKAGYIETPSPLAELARGIDGFKNAYLWRGYYHHRYIVWMGNGTLNFVTKYPMVEHFEFNEEDLENALRGGPELWNTYCLWSGDIKWRHREEPFDFEIKDYGEFLAKAVRESCESTTNFCNMVNEEMLRAA